MRHGRIIFVVISILVLLLASCSNDVALDREGTLVISISGGQSRGLLPAVSMTVNEYAVTVTDSSGTEVINTSLSPKATSVSYKLPAGDYTVRVDALNSEKTVIGSGETKATVLAGGTNTATVTIREIEGDGSFAVSITANAGYELTLKLFNLANEEVYSGVLKYVDGRYVTDGQVTKGNGFYVFRIVRTDTDAVVKSDSVRIVKGVTTTYSADFLFQSDGSLSIINEMVDIPAIRIELEEDVLDKEETLKASAAISGISDFTACWYIDGVAVGSFGEYADLSVALTAYKPGTHEVTLYVKNSQVIWSESESFRVENNEPIQIDISTLSANQWFEVCIRHKDFLPDKNYLNLLHF